MSKVIPKIKTTEDACTAEQKIKQAARKHFTQKGFSATRTRDIAEEAGINLALLNYYFRSKQKLYDIIMDENMACFKAGLSDLFANPDLGVHAKLEKIAHYYIDEFLANPDLPMFIIATIHSGKGNHSPMNDGEEIDNSRRVFVKQLHELMTQHKIKPIHPAHIISNLIGLILFPFVIKPMLKKRARINDKEFIELMKERRTLIPIWVASMLQTETHLKIQK